MNRRTIGWALIPGFAFILLSFSRAGSSTEVDSEPSHSIIVAADARLDLADAGAEKAAALVRLAQNPTAKDPNKPFGGHNEKAINYLERARAEIAAAKAFADDPKNQLSQ